MSTFYEAHFRVDSRDVDMFNQCRPSVLLGLLQEAATQASLELGASGPQMLARYHSLWMVSRSWVELEEPLRWNDRVTVRTWHRGGTGASIYRDFDIFREDRPVGQGVSVWVLVEVETHKLLRLKNLTEFQGSDGGVLNKTIKLHRADMPDMFDSGELREMRYSDTDINGHINNVHYADFACDALHLERWGKGRFVREFHIDYVGECRAGERIRVDTAVRGERLYARGQGADGGERFHFSMTLAEL